MLYMTKAIGRYYRKAVKTAGVKKIGRKFYKATGLVNPVKRGQLSVSRLYKDVNYLKSVLNPEKKQYIVPVTSYGVGQCNGDGYGSAIFDITPTPSQGVTGTTRNGNSIKVHSMVLKGQVMQMTSNHYQGKVKFAIFLNKGTPIDPTGGVLQIYDPNPVTGLLDYNSPRATDTFKNFVLLRSFSANIKQDNYSGVQGWKDFTIPLKFKSLHVKFSDQNTNTVTSGQLLLVILADSGNMSATTACTSGQIPITAVSTGFRIAHYQESWFYDN